MRMSSTAASRVRARESELAHRRHEAAQWIALKCESAPSLGDASTIKELARSIRDWQLKEKQRWAAEFNAEFSKPPQQRFDPNWTPPSAYFSEATLGRTLIELGYERTRRRDAVTYGLRVRAEATDGQQLQIAL